MFPSAAALGAGEVLVLALLAVGVLYVCVRLVRRWSQPRARPCPRCGDPVPNGVLTCDACGFDFTTIGKDKPGA